MSKYLRKYADLQAYKDDATRPTDGSSVSVAGEEAIYNGVNVIVPYRSASLERGDEKVFDKVEGVAKILKHGTYNAATFDSERYERSKAFFFISYADKDLFTRNKSLGNMPWAADNEYKVTCDLTQAGGFGYTCQPYGSAITGSCSWAAGDTIASVISQLTVGSGLAVSAIGDSAIKFSINTYNNGLITFSALSNATVVDCSFSARIGVNGTERGSHAGFQGQAVKTVFPNLEYMSANSTCICESGNNSSYLTNVRPPVFLSWATNNGASSFTAESDVTPMNKSVWDSLATDSDATHKALYDKYEGDYEKYLLSRRMKRDICKGVGSECREHGYDFTYALANCYFTDAEGNVKHVYPAAAACAEYGITVDGMVTGFEAGNWCMKSCTDLVESLTPEVVAELNKAIATTTDGQAISWGHEWSVGEYNGSYAWFFCADYGCLNNGVSMYHSSLVWPVLASEHV